MAHFIDTAKTLTNYPISIRSLSRRHVSDNSNIVHEICAHDISGDISFNK